ncbi:MAG: Unknown protein [uncultured Thiotrichaceae bacterium]|uniref:Response regulatory domain-containing protein n=1 Tax=uncultured Thiotrichaceae bacterium TaxID=298394 RepID=A0A6S6U6G2_9GAMM|nr:MAG: Unknown protein [uncultured Thiotrichaceae bacterium]
MTNPEAIGICLHQLVAREAAVIKRVIAFSSSQGRNYYATDLLTAQIVIVSDDEPVDFSQMNPQGSMIVRIAGQGSTEPYDVLMMRPLLVTRVMRTLDEAHTLLSATLDDTAAVPEIKAEAGEVVPAAETEVSQHEEAEQEAVTPPPDSHADAEVIEEAEAKQPAQAVESEEAGSVVSSAVEVVEADAQKSVQIADSDEADDDQHRALVVDDSAAIRKQLELELRDAGISADFAEDGEQAMEKVANNRYDLIFLDIIMPGIDGYETCRQMRMRSELKKTPIIMLSAKTSPLDEVQGVIAGASTYLTKPVKSEQLQSTLKRVSMWIDNFQAA